ncbi:acyl-CoA thioesterase [Xanthovirga aplysinae]|uniref:acyl-CoA thioesterase n=1 Tax=Xanthovirga aplysinae TaxID=2529853 RepID=UPI0012BCF7AA|nr:acyl-CoA thioesterase [Xanthovirga aplysinae]MTI31197.1 acyl-CoA thioesterase [Xanthovirga aplysinae]
MYPVTEARPVSYSKTTITELMIPSYANFGGKIHGGILLSLMDKVAYACASKHAGNYCVTVSVDEVNFLQAVEVGDLVSLKASVNYVGNTSLMVGIRVEAENIKSGTCKHTNTSYVTMVAKGEEHQTVKVPELILSTNEEVRRFMDAVQRKKIKQDYYKNMQSAKKAFEQEEVFDLLREERCRLELLG